MWWGIGWGKEEPHDEAEEEVQEGPSKRAKKDSEQQAIIEDPSISDNKDEADPTPNFLNSEAREGQGQ